MIREYWIPFIRHQSTAKIFFLFGANQNPEELGLKAENILVFDNVIDTLVPGILQKTILALDYIHANYSYKHILRTNLSSFFVESLLNIKSESLPSSSVYSGICGVYYNQHFVSGAGAWLSSDNVALLLKKREELLSVSETLPDDVAIGTVLTITSHQIERYDIIYNMDVESLDISILNSCYHFRIKNLNRDLDIKYMKKFTSHLYSAGNPDIQLL
jgi:hypothetical protein